MNEQVTALGLSTDVEAIDQVDIESKFLGAGWKETHALPPDVIDGYTRRVMPGITYAVE